MANGCIKGAEISYIKLNSEHPESGNLHSLPHTTLYCLIIKKKKKKKAALYTQKGKKVYSSQAKKSPLRPTLNWPAG